MKIAFLGYGSMTHALGSRWAANHDLFIGGRNPDKARACAETLGHGARHGDAPSAVSFGEVVVISVDNTAVFNIIDQAGGPDAFAGKTVVDINNPYNFDTGMTRPVAEGSLSQAIAAKLPGARVVKAFNCCQAKVFEMDPPVFDGRTLVTMYAGDHPQANLQTAELIRDIGSEPLELGPLRHAQQLEAMASVVIKFLMSGRDPYTVLNFIQPEVRPIG